MKYQAVPNSSIGAAHGAGIGAAQSVAQLGVKAVLTGQVGPNAHMALSQAGISVYTGAAGTVEATVSGIHDLNRALELLHHFEVEPLVCVNKYDLNTDNTDEITGFCEENDIAMVGCVPFDPEVTKAMVQGEPVIEYRPGSPASAAIVKVWTETRTHLGF